MSLLHFILGISLMITNGALETVSLTNEDSDEYYPSINWSDSFDWRLLKEFSTANKNILVSPISLKLALALLYQGSSGATEREFQNVFQFVNKKEVSDQFNETLTSLQVSERSEYVLNMGSRIFLHSEIQPKQKFASVAKESFRTDIEQTNFSEGNSSQAINSWIEKLTNGRISEIVKPDELTETIMLIANAVYFKGTWKHQFPKDQSAIGKFYVNNGDDILTITAPYMTTVDTFFFVESTNFDAKILRLPYKGNRYSMIILLPNSKAGLPSLLKKINLYSLKNLLYLMDKRTVKVTLPKFKFDFQARMKSTLQKFGLVQMFQNTASFPGIARGNNSLLRMLVVSDVIQKTGIEVDETGTVVYAATAIKIDNRFGIADDPEIFKATHPFVFFIEDEYSGNLLFAGKLENPLEDPRINIGNKIAESDVTFAATHPFLFFIEEETSGTVLFTGKLENPLEEEPVPLPPFKID